MELYDAIIRGESDLESGSSVAGAASSSAADGPASSGNAAEVAAANPAHRSQGPITSTADDPASGDQAFVPNAEALGSPLSVVSSSTSSASPPPMPAPKSLSAEASPAIPAKAKPVSRALSWRLAAVTNDANANDTSRHMVPRT